MLFRSVYPVPFGQISDFAAETSKSTPNGRSVFPIHGTSVDVLNSAAETIGNGDLTIHIRVDDPDYDVSAAGEDQIAENTSSTSKRGPLKIYVARGSDSVTLATAGGDVVQNGVITQVTTVDVTTTGDGVDRTRAVGRHGRTSCRTRV